MNVPVSFCALVAAAAIACGGGARSLSAPGATTQAVVGESAHFLLYFDGPSPSEARPALEALEASYDRIVADLQPASMPRVSAYIWSTASTDFQNTMIRSAGTYYPGVSGFVSGPTQLHVLLGTTFATSAVHEFVHCVTLNVNARFGNNPRWLWETVALYENRQFVDPATLGYLRAGQFPTLAELNAAVDQSGKIYQVGYVLGEFIVGRWGLEALRSLVRTNGNLESVLGLDAGHFEAAWRDWLTRTYLEGR